MLDISMLVSMIMCFAAVQVPCLSWWHRLRLQDDFNYDLLNSGSAAGGTADLPAGDTLSTGDAALWNAFMSSPDVPTSSRGGN